MNIKTIKIVNVKGIKDSTYKLNLIPNKPNLLVAPNGFGKSSVAIAFNSMNSVRIKLDKENFHENSEENLPVLELEFKQDNVTEKVAANSDSNSLAKKFDVFVINGQLFAKATKRNLGSFTSAVASLEIAPIILEKIPQKKDFNYKFSELRAIFRKNGKILPNISALFHDAVLIEKILSEINFNKFNSQASQRLIDDIINQADTLSGTAEEIKKQLEISSLNGWKKNEHLTRLAVIIGSQSSTISSEIDTFLAAVQIIKMHQRDCNNFKDSSKYLSYLMNKANHEKTVKDFYSGWASVKIKENKKKKKLFVEFPKAFHLSNGERDILSFIFMLQKARKQLRKKYCILIIDEIFDYLDDANLIAFQYYITQFITEFKNDDRELFPLLLTHLNPVFFHHFCFGEHKIRAHYLDKKKPTKSKEIIKLIEFREKESDLKDVLEKYYFHYHPNSTKDSQNLFENNKLKKDWGIISEFRQYIDNELSRYIKQNRNYDPVAVCFSIRIKTEEKIYNLLAGEKDKEEFLEQHGTSKKLNFAEFRGVEVEDKNYLLGIIYNDALHWKQDLDIVSPIVAKLENLTIKNLIKEISEDKGEESNE